MADFKDERAYDSKKLTQWFLGSSLVLLVCVAWMAYKDYHRSWKEYQREFLRMDKLKTKGKYEDLRSKFNFDQYKQLKSDLREAQKEMGGHQASIDDINGHISKIDAQTYKTKVIEYQPLKAHIDADKYKYSEGVKNGDADAGLKKTLDDEMDQAALLTQQLFVLGQQKDDATKQLAELTGKRDAVQAKITKMRADLDQLAKKFHSEVTSPFHGDMSDGLLFQFRNAMLLDFMSPTIQVQQIILKDIPEDMYFAKTMRVDRCTTCHQAIDKKGYEDAPEPFRTHPHLDLYLGANSPHPLDKIGCTICHGGMGQALDFRSCAHVPNDKAEEKRWKEDPKLNWSYPEGFQSVMLPLKFTEGSCLKCHGTQEKVNFADKLNRGRELMVVRGCVGCHKVKGLDQDLPKAGPDLVRVAGKLKKEFALKWIWSPTSYNHAAKMPSFFQQSNNSDPDSIAKNKAEVNALVDFLYDRSESYTPNLAPGAGSAANGKKLFHEVGCMACHGIDDVTAYHADFAPDLSSVGSKLSPAFIYSWIKNPQHFNPNSRMPSLRLSDQEASDITAYLMSKRNKEFEEAPVPESDPAVRDGLITMYLVPQLGTQGAAVSLAAMDDHTKSMFLGEKTLNKYGCFACHAIKGFETAQRIGTELSTWGSKQISQLDFGFTDKEEIPHTHEDFLANKLMNPRLWDKDKVVSFQDKLKMPNFYLNDEDREAIMTAVLGLTNTYVPDVMTAGIHGNGPLLEKGRRVIANYNCRGCHLIEKQGAKIRAYYKSEGMDFSMAPPDLNKEGAKVQVDWIHNFFKSVHPIRPWLHIRMPSFPWTDEQLSDVISYFNYKEDQVYPFQSMAAPKLSGEDLTQAKELFAQLQCQKCHIFGSQVPKDLSSAAPDLLKVHERLKPDWVVLWLKNPEALMPGARMPSFWPQPDKPTEPEGPSPYQKYFHGDSQKQREALRDYLFSLGKGSSE